MLAPTPGVLVQGFVTDLVTQPLEIRNTERREARGLARDASTGTGSRRLIDQVDPVAALALRGRDDDDVAIRNRLVRDEARPHSCRDGGLAGAGRPFYHDYSLT